MDRPTDIREFTLGNGLRVGLQRTQTETVSGRLRVRHGPLNERPGEEGIAHLLEHVLCSGGTERYAPPEAEKIVGSFGFSNATTTPFDINFQVDMLAQDAARYLDVVPEIAFKPRLDPERLKQEQGRVLREISDAESSPHYRGDREFRQALLQHSRLACSPLGKREVVAAASQSTLRDFHGRGFFPNNADLILVGQLPDNIEALIEKNFGNLRSGQAECAPIPPIFPLNKRTILDYTPSTNKERDCSVQLELSVVCDYPDEDRYPLHVLDFILGKNNSSRLMKVLSSEKGLVYGISSNFSPYFGPIKTGQFFVYGNISGSRSEEVIDTIFSEVGKIKKQPVRKEEITGVIGKTEYQLVKHFETNVGRSQAIEMLWDFDRYPSPKRIVRGFGEVTPGDVQRVAQRYLPNRDGNYVMRLMAPL